MEKKPWQKPELIVLVRSRPEEAVLTGCKYGVKNRGNHGPAHNQNDCFAKGGTCAVCLTGTSS